jgi:cell division protein FtsN
VVPETAAVPATARTTTARASEPTAIEPGSYLLQVGSFRTHADADRRKASIALLGYESQIQQATVNGDVVHRVLVGPIADQAALDTARRRFGAENFDTLVLKAAQ